MFQITVCPDLAQVPLVETNSNLESRISVTLTFVALLGP